MRSSPARIHVAGTDRLEVAHQADHLAVGQRVSLHVHDRLREAGTNERVAEIVHVDEMVHLDMAVHGRPGAAQLDHMGQQGLVAFGLCQGIAACGLQQVGSEAQRLAQRFIGRQRAAQAGGLGRASGTALPRLWLN